MKTKLYITTITLLILSVSISRAQTAYVPNILDNTVSVINIATNTVTHTIPVGIQPEFMCVSNDGARVYVAAFDSIVSVISTATNTVVATIRIRPACGAIAVSPDGSKLYVSNNNDTTVSVFSTSTYSEISEIVVGYYPYGIAVSPDGNKLYVGTLDSTVSVINTTNNNVIALIHTGGNTPPGAISVSPDGNKVYVLCGNIISVINTATNTITDSIANGGYSGSIAVSADGSRIYVLYGGISVINAIADTILTFIPVSAYANDVSVTPDGTKVYVTHGGQATGNTVSVINTATNTVIDTITVGSEPIPFGNFISIYNPLCFAYYTTTYDSTINTFTLVVDSSSLALATSYHWDFGDGTTSTLAYPTHTYAVDSLYNVCMKIHTAAGDSCEFCHIIGIDSLGHVHRSSATGFTLNVQNNTTLNVPNNTKESTITIAPNPFTSQTTITFSELQKNTTIKIMDVLGKEVRHVILSAARNLTIDKGTMQAGIYFVQITDEKGNAVNRKVVVE